MKVPRLFRRILSDLIHGENLDAYVAIALGVALTILGVIGSLKVQWLQNFTILVLTFLVLVSLKNRQALQDTERLLRASKTADASQMLLDRTDYESLDDRLSGAEEVIVIGRHLLGFVGFNRDTICKFARKGCVFKFIVADPAASASPQDVERSLQILHEIATEIPNKIVVRVTARALPCAAFTVDVNSQRGLIQIQPHALFRDSDLRAHYDLRAAVHSRWYDYYKEQIGLLWDDSRPVTLLSETTS